MGEKSKIEWCDHTFNPWIGCTKVSPGCDRCYAEAMMDHRYHRVKWGPHGERVRTSTGNWRLPLLWAKAARERAQAWSLATPRLPERPRVFCASLADVFDNQVDPHWRWELFELIGSTLELDWLLLTKRPENIEKQLLAAVGSAALDMPRHYPNVWLGFTAEDQEHFDRRWPIVREIPAAVRFCSYEPAIGPLRLYTGPSSGYHTHSTGLDWLICGGESGAGHRTMELQWESNVRQDCEIAGIAYFCKQNSGKKPFPAGYPVVREFPVRRET